MPHDDTSPRDMVGYGGNPPDPKWPSERGSRSTSSSTTRKARSRRSRMATALPKRPLTEAWPAGGFEGRDLAAEFDVRVWQPRRLLAHAPPVVRARHLPLTVFGCALALERNPRPAREPSGEAGYDVCCPWLALGAALRAARPTERERIRTAVASLKRTIGQRAARLVLPLWARASTRASSWSRKAVSLRFRRYNDELPYWTRVMAAASGRAVHD